MPCVLISILSYFSHETGLAIFKDDELAGLIEETVPAISVPACAGAFVTCNWGRVIQADNKGSGLDLVQKRLILGMSSQQSLTVLEAAKVSLITCTNTSHGKRE